ncbi:MAG: cell division protein SepF [Veillonellaceae bacterium]|nr:cell division protein SepF [Veillonellaceae bacterium]
MSMGDMWKNFTSKLAGGRSNDEYYDDYDDYEEEAEEERYEARSAARPTVRRAKEYRMIVVEPYTFEDSKKIADHLKEYRPVVINLEKTEEEVGRRLIDFVGGVTYALEGHIERVSAAIFLAVPNNMSVDTENYTYSTSSVPNMDTQNWGVR